MTNRLGSGEITPDSVVLDEGIFQLGGDSVHKVTPDLGPYTVELLDAQGQVLASWHFAIRPGSNADASTTTSLFPTIPAAEGTHGVAFLYQGKELGATTASPHAPSLQFASPAGAHPWPAEGEQAIAWQGSDAGGGPLTYLLQYSPDGGRTWITLANNPQGNSLTIDLGYFPGGSQSQLKLVASDRFNTSMAISQPFSVPAKTPLRHIADPLEGASLTAGSPLVLRAFATDLQEAALPSDGLSWSSDRRGALGRGEKQVIDSLSVGEHTLTFTATNAEGLGRSQRVHIKVEPASASASQPSRSPLIGWLLLAMILVLILAMALVFIRVILRRAGAGSDNPIPQAARDEIPGPPHFRQPFCPLHPAA
jgi:hypothetical protein